MKKVAKISPFRLTSLLRLEKNPKLALQLFQHPNPQSNNHPPSSQPPFHYTSQSYDIILCKLARSKMFIEMEQILNQMANQSHFTPKEAIFCQIISSYGRARMPDAALRTFLRIPSFRRRPTILSFNTLLTVLLRHRHISNLQSLCRDLDAAQFSPDACTYNILIRAGSVHAAYQLFDEMSEKKIQPTVATFGAVISALASASLRDEAFRVKDEMVRTHGVKPNASIYASLAKLLCKGNEIDRAIGLKDEMASDKEVALDAAIYTTLIRGLFRAGRKGEVVGILEEMKGKKVRPETATYNAIIAGFCEEGDIRASLEALEEMKRRECEPDVVSYNTIVMGMCRMGRWRDARDLFEDMPRQGCRPDVVTYRAVFDGICAAGESREAELMVEEMAFNGYYPAETSFRKLVEGVLVVESLRVRELVDLLSWDVGKG